jgi:para-aminobenzoate synthetase component 1
VSGLETLPLVRRVDIKTEGVSLYDGLQDSDYSFLLNTGMHVGGLGHHSFVGALPFMTIECKNGRVKVTREGEVKEYSAQPLDELRRFIKKHSVTPFKSKFPFNGGAVGFFSYDLGRYLERIPSSSEDDLQTPDYCLAFYDVIAAFDHRENATYIISNGLPAKGEQAIARARDRMDELEIMLRAPKSRAAVTPANGIPEGHFTREEYMDAVQKVVDYIYAGDIFQANLSQRFSVAYKGDPWALFCRLHTINPAPFAAYLNFGDFKVISASPERFLKVVGPTVETRPIKGTRPRGETPLQDQQLREELWNSEKDRAELMMIVDLERNDLGRVCKVGSVRVPELLRLEEYATVFHLVSTVVGELPGDKDFIDLLAAAFPGGSITGAPKIRAMEIIEELEPVRRGIYTGSIGYLGFDGRADLNIVIRTIIAKGDRLYYQVGGGITADSNPLAEYEETLHKARALMNALGLK